MLNQAQIIGHLGRDPEVRYMPNGTAVASFSIATSEKWKDKTTGEAKEATEWHRISAFDKLAEIIGQYVKKGSLIYVCGKIKTRKYTDKDGAEKYATEIHATEMKMLGGRDGSSSAPPHPAGENAPTKPADKPTHTAPAQAQSGFDDMEDDIPF
jgi:single-strand DNA-binding protein